MLCRPFLIDLESGNVVFEEMEKPEYQEKTKTKTIEGRAPKTLRNFFHFKPETEVIEIIYFLMFASFCFPDETVRYAAILCLTKTHSRDEEPKNQ